MGSCLSFRQQPEPTIYFYTESIHQIQTTRNLQSETPPELLWVEDHETGNKGMFIRKRKPRRGELGHPEDYREAMAVLREQDAARYLWI